LPSGIQQRKLDSGEDHLRVAAVMALERKSKLRSSVEKELSVPTVDERPEPAVETVSFGSATYTPVRNAYIQKPAE
jgi:hypothetical protein